MKNSEFLTKISEIEIDKGKTSELERLYGFEMPDIIGKIMSVATDPIFLDECRILPYKEVCNADDYLGTNFVSLKIVPVADCGDNDFIVYHYNTGDWSKFNIVDETVFKRRETFLDFFDLQ